MSSKAPRLIVIAGANGSGKTTFGIPYSQEIGIQFLNADEFAKAYAENGESNAMIKGGREFFRRLNSALLNSEDVVIETTLSGTYTEKVVHRAKAKGYSVQIIYIFLGVVQTCVDRVAIRVIKGGHHVPEDDIVRRYYRSISNFRNRMSTLADEWFLFYNGNTGFEPVALGQHRETTVLHRELYQLFNSIS